MLRRRSRIIAELEKLAISVIPALASVGQKGARIGDVTRRHGGKILVGGLAVPAIGIEGSSAYKQSKAGLSEENFRARMAGRAPGGAPKRRQV